MLEKAADSKGRKEILKKFLTANEERLLSPPRLKNGRRESSETQIKLIERSGRSERPKKILKKVFDGRKDDN